MGTPMSQIIEGICGLVQALTKGHVQDRTLEKKMVLMMEFPRSYFLQLGCAESTTKDRVQNSARP